MPSDPRDYKLDISSTKQAESGGSTSSQTSKDSRPYLQALFACCNVYQRIYRSSDNAQYIGACPRCGKRVRFVVGPGGTTSRSFVIE